MTPEELVAMAMGLESTMERLCKEHSIAPVPRLEWSTRMRRQLGKAYPSLNLIRLSIWLDEQQANETLRHELAHIASGTVHQAPHGPGWQTWAVKLGANPRATSLVGPSLAPAVPDRRRYYGIECAGCGLRTARIRVLAGLYHRDCGPKKGALKKMVQGGREAVLAWVAEGKSTKPAEGT